MTPFRAAIREAVVMIYLRATANRFCEKIVRVACIARFGSDVEPQRTAVTHGSQRRALFAPCITGASSKQRTAPKPEDSSRWEGLGSSYKCNTSLKVKCCDGNELQAPG